MIKSKFIVLITISLLILFPISFFLCSGSEFSYPKMLFDDSKVHSINILVDENIWDEYILFKKENYKIYKDLMVDIVIDDIKISNVSLAVKGGSSYDFIYRNEELDKFSFKVDFNRYINGQTYYGLESLTLNNLVRDNTYLKQSLAYDAFAYAGIPTPLVSYTEVYVNDRYWGLYLCIEDWGESFIKRNNLKTSNLYKPYYDINEQSDGDIYYSSDLVYRGDEFSHYHGIFNDSLKPCSNNEKMALIKNIKLLNDGNLKDSVSINKVIKYFAVNNFLNGRDSYLSEWPHNYYLYLDDGLINILPWDCDAVLLMVETTYKDVLNSMNSIEYDIDERPLWKYIINNDEYRSAYIDYLKEFAKGYVVSGVFEERYRNLELLIDDYIKKDLRKNNVLVEFGSEYYNSEYYYNDDKLGFCKSRRALLYEYAMGMTDFILNELK